MKLFLLIVFLVALPLPAQVVFPPDAAHFMINQGNHAVGHSDFSIKIAAPGSPPSYAVSSHGSLAIQNTKYSFSGSTTLDRELAIVEADLNGIVNGSAVTFAIRNSGNNLAVNISASGRNYQNSLSRQNLPVLFPDFDLASYEVLLAMRAAHPSAPLIALIPKQTGQLVTATLAPQADVQATLKGFAQSVHHSSLTIGSVVSELYYASTNRIMEVDIPSQTFALVREGFQLLQPPPPPADAAPGAVSPNGAQTEQPQ